MIGSVSAMDTNVTADDSNLLNANNKIDVSSNLEVSSNDSISETFSHDDNGLLTSQYISDDIIQADDVISTSLTGNDTELYFKNGTAYKVVLSDSEGKLLANQKVILNINGNNYTRTTNDDGLASIAINLNPGNYDITSYYVGTGSYGSSSTTNIVKVLSTISGEDIEKYYRNATQYCATFVDGQGNLLNNATVTFNINGVFYERRTNGNGTAKLNINLNAGNYIITAINPINGQMDANNITVLTSIFGSDIVKYYKNDTQYYATFVNEVGSPLANTNVTFNINGVFYTRTSNSDGDARLNINLDVGNYIITSTDENGLSIANTITINKANTTITGENTYMIIDTERNYTVSLKSENNQTMENVVVYFRYGDIYQTAVTNGTGQATIIISNVSEGTYSMEYGFEGNGNYLDCNGSSKLVVANSTVILIAEDLVMDYKDGSRFNVTVTDLELNPLANETITFTIHGVQYNRTTNSEGVAGLAINLLPGTYVISYTHSTLDSPDYNEGSDTIVINKLPAKLIAEDLFMEYGEDAYFTVTLLDSNNKALNNSLVNLTIHGVSYVRSTNASGAVRLHIALSVGYYEITTSLNDLVYYADTITNHVLVNGSILEAEDLNMIAGTTAYFSATLYNAYREPISNATIGFEYEGIVTSAVTNSEGIASIPISGLVKGVYPIVYSYEPASIRCMAYINVGGTIPISDLVNAANTVNTYIEANTALPTSVVIGGETYTTAQYLYLLSEAIIAISNGDYSDLVVLSVNDPTNPGAAADMGNLQQYIPVASTLLASMDAGVTPNSVDTSIGTVGYDAIVYAFTRVLVYYGLTSQLPASVSVKSLKIYEAKSVLDSKNTITDLGPYLSSSTNCQVTNAAIVALANKLTYGLTNSYDKALAIYNYVRDEISYTFYYDTRYGAVGTLNAGTGNCVDQAHLSVALYRAAGLPARYAHGTCVFSSGSTYGHVWVQVLIGDTWIVSDTTSTRNSFDNVVNWNNYNYSLKGYYSSISF